MSIAILAKSNKYFAAWHLAKALNTVIYGLNTKKINIDHLILIGMRALEWYSKYKEKNFKTVAVIFSDTNFCRHYLWCNNYVNKNNIYVYAMPDLEKYLECKYIPAYQTIILPEIDIEKPKDKIIICHSPGIKAKDNIKGTKQIKLIIDKLKDKYNYIEYLQLTNLSWEKCIKVKSKAHIFIDQLIKNNPHISQERFGNKITYNGALGKSGIEGMLLKCCTITTMDQPHTEPYFPPPPVLISDYLNFECDLEKLIINENYRNYYINKQYDWVKKYCNPKFVAKHITQHIGENYYE